MKVNTNQKIHCYTQGQQAIASILLIVCLLASLSLESALATSESTGDTRAPLLSQPAEDQDSSLRQYAQGSFETADDKTRQLLHQAAKEQDPTLRQALAYALAKLAKTDANTLALLHQAAKDQNEDIREIALEACNAASSTYHTDKKQVLQKFFKQAVAINDVPRLSKLILENIDEVGKLCESLVEEENLLKKTLPQEVGELCESLEADLLRKTLPQTADTLLTWGVEHNQYELVQFIIEHGRQHITTNDEKCVGQRVTKIAAEKGYQELFLLLINNAVDVDSRNITAFMSAIICGQYTLAQAMIRLGEDRLEQPDNNGYTPQKQLKENQKVLQIFREEKLQQQAKALEELLLQKFFKQAVAINDVPRLSKLILENTHEVGDLCESLEADLLRKTLPQTADTLLTWGVEHNQYELVQLIIEHGRQHITNKLGYSLGQKVTKTAAQKGYQELFLLLINNGVDVDTRKRTAFVSAIICGQYTLAQAMIRLGEDRLEQPNDQGKTPQGYLDEKQRFLKRLEEQELLKQAESLKLLLSQKIQAMQQNKPKEEQQASSKKEQ